MKILVVGATGVTGKLVVELLLKQGNRVKAIVRSPEKLAQLSNSNQNLEVISENLLELTVESLVKHLSDCSAVVSCLGHNLTLKGIYGKPRKLVRDATHLICEAIKVAGSKKAIKYILMNTAGNSNRDLDEQLTFGEKCVLTLLRLLLPPHVDNELAADYLRTRVGQNDQSIEWVVVRPDSLIDEDSTSKYETHPSPTRSAIFNPGKTSRINVAYFMVELTTEDKIWENWKGKMPVIYNLS